MVRAISGQRPLRLLRRGWLTLVLVAVIAAVVASSASAVQSTPMNCPQSNYCKWGYNYVTPNANYLVYGPYKYWFDQYFSKNSGGTVYHGFGPSSTCYRFESGAASWYGYPSSLGCSGLVNPYTQYYSGNSSYLYFDDYT